MSERTRNYATIVYPESAPEDWLEVLSELLVPALVSPLHDRDLTKEGEQKKPHFHVMLLFSGVKSPEQAKEVFDQIGGVGCEKVMSARAYARYLIHMDQPDKVQYNRQDVVTFSGVDYDSLVNLPEDRYKAIKEIVDYCCKADIYSYSDLMEYCGNWNWTWFKVLCDNSVTIREYLRSRTWTHGMT